MERFDQKKQADTTARVRVCVYSDAHQKRGSRTRHHQYGRRRFGPSMGPGLRPDRAKFVSVPSGRASNGMDRAVGRFPFSWRVCVHALLALHTLPDLTCSVTVPSPSLQSPASAPFVTGALKNPRDRSLHQRAPRGSSSSLRDLVGTAVARWVVQQSEM
jgi:hypothetical protein